MSQSTSGYTLGLNGWFERSHDASACIVRNGEILAMVEEERFTRQKHAYDRLPHRSIAWCLKQVGITLDDIDTVAIGWDLPGLYRQAGLSAPSTAEMIEAYFPKKYFDYQKIPSIEIVPHHLAHAASSFFLSGQPEASILIIDGQGEDASTTWAVGRGNTIEIIDTQPIKDSLGYFYEAVSDFIGLGHDAAGKTMGLAPYGQATYDFPEIALTDRGFIADIPYRAESGQTDQQAAVSSAWKEVLVRQFGQPNIKTRQFSPIDGDFKGAVELSTREHNIAASAQKALEKALTHTIECLIRRTGISNLCLAGGVALNCSSNTEIHLAESVSSLFIPPFTNDAGVSVGAALYVGKQPAKTALRNAYLGPSYSNDEIEQVLKSTNVRYRRATVPVEQIAAELILNNKIVSWFQGRAEIGPRALGARSILANPSWPDAHRRVNEAKKREQWRPLAPSILEEQADNYLESSFTSPFMLHTFKVREDKKSAVPAIVHVDGSTRPQTVNREDSPLYHSLISNLHRLGGAPLVLNTSFNGAKEPVVNTPTDAIASFYTNSTDYLIIGDFIVEK